MEWYWIVLICLLSITLLYTIMSLFYYPFFKRILDFLLCFLALILLSPLYIILAILTRIKLGGPVLFKQIRPGKNGKLFVLYKFRSMTNEKDKEGNLLSDEKRLTKFGKWLRKTSLDEIPEIFNILKGDMSIIGPRPQLVKDYVFFDEQTMNRQTVKPGLSGLAQVNGRNNISWEDKFKFDLDYINKITLFLDFKIVLKTIGKAFFKKENINREGFATDEDYGDYLLRTNKISLDVYNSSVLKAKEMVSSYGK